jgi:hypothetical protein
MFKYEYITKQACHLRDPHVRCPRSALNMSETPSYLPGDMNAMFEGLIDKYSNTYDITVLSRDPWVVTFDNFLTDLEAKSLISTVTHWEHSTDTGSANEFGEEGRILSQGRTSSNAWCGRDCAANPNVRSIARYLCIYIYIYIYTYICMYTYCI